MSNVVCLLQQAQANGSWNSPIQVSGNAAAANVLAAEQNADGTLEVFWCDPGNNIQHSWQTASGSSTWSAATGFDNGGQALQMAMARDNQQRLVILWISPAHQLRLAVQTSPSNHANWAFSTFPGTATQVTVYANLNGLLEAFFIGTDTFIYHTVQQANLSWSTPVKTPWAGKQVTLARNVDGRLELFYVGTNDLIYHAWQPSPNNDNYAESVLSGGARTIVAGNNSNGTITIFYIGTDGYVYHNTQEPSNGVWGGNIRAFQSEYYNGQALAIGCSRNADGRLQLIYEGTDTYLYSSWQETQNGAYTGGLRGGIATAFAALTDSNGCISQFYIGQTLGAAANFTSNNQVGADIYIQYSGLVPNSQIQIEMNEYDTSTGSVTSNNPVITVDSAGYGTFPVPNALIPASPKYIHIKALENGFLLAPPVQYPSSTTSGTPIPN